MEFNDLLKRHRDEYTTNWDPEIVNERNSPTFFPMVPPWKPKRLSPNSRSWSSEAKRVYEMMNY